MRPLLLFQIPVVEYAQANDLAAILCDKRLGKTTCAIRWALARDGVRNVLVVAPKSAIPGWCKELKSDEQWAFDLTEESDRNLWIKCLERLGDITPKSPHFCVVNAQQLFLPRGRTGDKQPIPTEIALFPWDAVIWDESRILANPQAQTAKVANACFRSVPNRCILSGEYAPEGPEDVFGQMVWAFGSFMGETNYYRWIHKNFEKDQYRIYPKPGMLEQIKKEVHRLSFVLSRKDAGIGEVKCYDERYCELSPKLQKIYDHAEKWWELEGLAEVSDELAHVADCTPTSMFATKYAPVAHNWLRQIAGGSPKHFPQLHSAHKLKLLWEVLDEYRHESVVVSFKYNAELFAARAFLEKKGVDADCVWGGLGVPERNKAVSFFQKGTKRVILKQCAIHFGMDLSRASTMIRYSLPDRYEDLSQDADRIVHPTKDMVAEPLLYIDLVCKDTVDEDVLAASRDKSIDARYFMSRIIDNYKARLARKAGL